jgi:hypothetical protein
MDGQPPHQRYVSGEQSHFGMQPQQADKNAQLHMQLQQALLKAQQQTHPTPTALQPQPPPQYAAASSTAASNPVQYATNTTANPSPFVSLADATSSQMQAAVAQPAQSSMMSSQQQQQQQITKLLEQVFAQDQNPSKEKILKLAAMFQTRPEAILEWFVKRKQMEAMKMQMLQQQQRQASQTASAPTASVIQAVPQAAASTISSLQAPSSQVSQQSSQARPSEPLCIVAVAVIIGNWTWKCKYVGDFCMEIDFAKESLAWLRLHSGFIQKIQFQFSQVNGMLGNIVGNFGQLQLILSSPPVFLEEADPMPPEGTNLSPKKWKPIDNFTGNPMSNLLIHRIVLSRQVYAKVDMLLRNLVPRFRELLEQSAARNAQLQGRSG